MKKYTSPFIWQGEPNKKIKALLKAGKSTTEILREFPMLTYRQVDWKIAQLVATGKYKRAVPLKRRNYTPPPVKRVAIDFSVFDFTGDNMQVNDQYGHHVDVRLYA